MSSNLFYNNTFEAEQAVLGALLVSKTARNDMVSTLEVDDFVDEKHQIIFEAINNLITLGVGVDIPSLVGHIDTSMKALDKIGGVAYLYELSETYVGDTNAFYHIQILKDASLSRKLVNTMQNCIDGFKNKKINDVSQYIAECENKVINITQSRRVAEFVTASQVVKSVTKKLQITKKEEKINKYCVGIPTGYESLDKLTQGWQKGSLIILAARPSVGKTAFSVNLIHNAAKLTNRPVAFFSLEMDSESICRRLLSCVAQINSVNLATGNLSPIDWSSLETAVKELSEEKIFIDDTSNEKLNNIRTKATKLKSTHPDLAAIFIDYLGLITTNIKLGEVSKANEVAEISRSLKQLARELEVPIICLCQLSRANEKASRKPMLSDLRDSGSIEQDADQVIFIHRDNYQKTDKIQDGNNNSENNDNDSENPFAVATPTEIIVSKNRNGRVGIVNLQFLANIGKFVELDVDHKEF